jgi:hypothetical protein
MHQSHRIRRKAWLAFSAAASCLAGLVLVLIAAETMSMWLNVSLGFITMLACIVFLVWGGTGIYEANQFTRMERGEGVIARWTVDPVSWRNYLALRHRLEAQHKALPNYPKLPDEAQSSGMEVVICERTLFVGSEVWPIGVENAQMILPESLLEIEHHSEEGDTYITSLPVPSSAQHIAEQVVQHFKLLGKERLRESHEAKR